MSVKERQEFLENMRNRDHERRNNMNMEERQQFLEKHEKQRPSKKK